MLHLLLILTIGGKVLYQISDPAPDFAPARDYVNVPDAALQPPPVAPTLPTTSTEYRVTISTPSSPVSAAGKVIITTVAPGKQDITRALETGINSTPIAVPTVINPPPVPASTHLDAKQLDKIRSFANWAAGGSGDFGKSPRNRKFEFTAYVARYQGSDWDSTIWMDGDQMRGGSLQNLLFVIGHLSKNKILANAQPVPLDLSNDEIFQKKPPFIFFTGHRDFRLTDKELENLAEYLRVGGCIWGDSSLPGQRSRFDIAFRREMRRLLPDPSIQWQPLPASHPIYTNTYFPEIKTVPAGINFYDEPVYGLTGYGGEIAVIYTANDYGDMWQFGIDENGQIDLSRDEKRRMIATNEQMWRRRNLYFGNIEPKSLFDTYKFGTNVIIHLLTRWEEKIRFAALMGGI